MGPTTPILRRWGIALLLALILPTACSERASGPETEGDPGETITLQVRVHVLESPDIAALDAPIEGDRVDELMAEADRIWDQAEIDWRVEDVHRERARGTDDFVDMIEGEAPPSDATLLEVLPDENRVAGGWDVFLVRNLGAVQAAGAYLGDGRMVSTLIRQGGDLDVDGFASRVLAHELGHSLSLQHVPCEPPGNLMAPGCPAEDRTRLEEPQIEAARRQARTGRPF